MLVSGAEAVDLARRVRNHGVTGDLQIEWKGLIAFKRTLTDPVPKKREEDFAKRGIDAFHGLARFTGADRVAVGDRTLRGRHVLIATGARPAMRIPYLDPAKLQRLLADVRLAKLGRKAPGAGR